MDRGAWFATVHGVAKSQTRLSAHSHTYTHTHSSSMELHNNEEGGLEII